MTSSGWYSDADGAGTQTTNADDISTWIFGSTDNTNPSYDTANSNPKVNTADLGLGCTKDCRAFSDGSNTFKYSD